MTTPTTQPTLHMVGNAHLDPVWLWRWQEGVAEAIGTCWAAIDRLEEGDGFVFSKGEAQVYAWIEELDPDLFAKIAHYVASGRWRVVNGWWIQPDCNVPSGESVIRQALYGKRYFKSRFGIDVPTGYNVDSFGHPGTFPMLLQHTGSTSYTYSRPAKHEMTLPQELFTWRSPDGSEVTAFRIQGAYNTSKREMPLPQKTDLSLEWMAEWGHSIMVFYGVGNHGGAPTIENINEIDRRIEAGENLKYSDPERFFNEVPRDGLPVIDHGLQFHAIGCYAAASSLKTGNRKAEALLEQAEAAATLAHREAGTPYPREKFEELWRTLLFNQFHDTLGGTSIESACIDSERELAMVAAGAEIILNASVRHLGRLIGKPVDPTDATFFVMNFNGQDAGGLLEAEPWVDKDVISKRVVMDEEGNLIPFQYTDPAGKTTGLQRIVFPASVPAYGYRTWRFVVDERGTSAPPISFGASTDLRTFETGGYRLTLDAETGAIGSLTSKREGIELFTGPGHLATIVEDPTDTWGHGPSSLPFDGTDMRLAAVTLIETGPVRTVIKVVAEGGASVMTTKIVLPEDASHPVELRVHLNWREERCLLRLAYPLGMETFEFEIPGGWDAHPTDGSEVPGQRFMRATGGGHEIAVLNDAKYSYAVKDGTLFMTAVRAPVFAHHDPNKIVDGSHYRYMDQGEQAFTINLFAAPKVSRKEAFALAETLNKPLVTTPHVSRGGTRAHTGQWLAVEADHSAITALKVAEEGNGTIVRAVELDGTDDTLRVAGRTVPLRPRGITTARLTDAALTPCSGLED
ncbi:glycoside hydrolase family 38 C-terminal domain-containing protein [Acuticoccus sp. MNP-M23]|uniref:glycoside hydrolase family 38 N-terminal domain-containing protein n=1 Tax=Acuticoccus sp. MNP-M23 TaxID=3072793 RepID=UPI002814C301|nr:glycoside hydrolase family 38 C-terminal domain-containing protein [Acuticoccus sp. MNP-M23]WMS41435.1 glycoside hydrolase family 38 C-terminal domain-containing protein [Acuticoccus sp. MNP-M23]